MIDELKRIHMFRYTAPHTKHASQQYDEPNSVRTAAMLLHLFKGIEHFQPDKYKRNAIICFNTTLCVLRIDIILRREASSARHRSLHAAHFSLLILTL